MRTALWACGLEICLLASPIGTRAADAPLAGTSNAAPAPADTAPAAPAATATPRRPKTANRPPPPVAIMVPMVGAVLLPVTLPTAPPRTRSTQERAAGREDAPAPREVP